MKLVKKNKKNKTTALLQTKKYIRKNNYKSKFQYLKVMIFNIIEYLIFSIFFFLQSFYTGEVSRK